MNQLSVEAIKKINANELKSELVKRGLAVQGEKELFKRLNDGIQEDNSDMHLSISLIKEIFERCFKNEIKKHNKY